MKYVETTHEVTNQPPLLVDYDAFTTDAALGDALRGGLPAAVSGTLSARFAAYGRVVGSASMIEQAFLANRYVPELATHDRFGHRVDEVRYHPAYHAIMRAACEHEVHSIAWTQAESGGQVAHAVLLYLHAQLEAGSACPLTMTHAAVPALRTEPSVAAVWEPKLLKREYDSANRPIAAKQSATLGMAMTEKQGGSDVRANTTRARPLAAPGPGEAYELHGHKWFCSAPMSDGFLTLAHAEGGLSCFLVPRWLEDGSRNRMLLQRLKDKLGNRSNASSEVEYDRTWSVLIGEEGRGVATILQMVAMTRVDCAAGSAGLMRAALVQALHHAHHRSAFGARLDEQPLMQRVLADLALEVEAATMLFVRVAAAYDANDPRARAFARGATPIAKYWITHRAPGLAFEAMECLGGAGYVEESTLPRLYREAPVNSIWEGSGNVQCLDFLRAVRREPELLPALLEEIAAARGAHRGLDQLRARLERELGHIASDAEARARSFVEQLAIALSASLLIRAAPSFVADAYCASRLDSERGHLYGALPASVDARALLARAWPA